MPLNEMRKDYILNRWVVIASQRKQRPSDFVRASQPPKQSTCPFCPGNEDMTPPAIFVYRQVNGKIMKDRDTNDFRHKDWLVRCVPNLYPAFSPPRDGEAGIQKEDVFESADALGHHQVIVESPRHDEHPGVAQIAQLTLVISAYRDCVGYLSSHEYVRYVSVFRNHGLDAGASLSHAHTQVIATPILPRTVAEEVERSRSFWDETKRCIFCDIIEKEEGGQRLAWQSDKFIVFCPWASVDPFEFWIFPKRHMSTILGMAPNEEKDLARTLRVCLGGLRSILQDPPYNFAFHMTPDGHYHWHIEVYPKLSIWAGLEKGTGLFINVMPPEEASLNLREAIKSEEEKIGS